MSLYCLATTLTLDSARAVFVLPDKCFEMETVCEFSLRVADNSLATVGFCVLTAIEHFGHNGICEARQRARCRSVSVVPKVSFQVTRTQGNRTP